MFLWDESKTGDDVRVAHWKAIHDNIIINILHQLLIKEFTPEDGDSPSPYLVDHADHME